MTKKQKETIIKLKEEIVRLKKKNTELRTKKGLKKVIGFPRKKLPARPILMTCQGCGQRIMSNQKHTLEDCKKYSQTKAQTSKPKSI